MNINLVQLSFHNIPIKTFNFIKSDFYYFINSSSAKSPLKIDSPIDPFPNSRTHFSSCLDFQAATMMFVKSSIHQIVGYAFFLFGKSEFIVTLK